MTLEKEKPIIEETSASSIDQIASDVEHASNDIAEQQLSSAGGQEQKKDARSAQTGLTGLETGPTGPSGISKKKSRNNKKERPSFKQLLAKYEEKGATQKQKKRPDQAKDTNPSSEHREQSASHVQQGNNAFAPYSFGGPIAPWFWSYPYYYTPMDYSRMYMHPYFIQYSSIYPSYGASQRPIVASNNLVKSKPDCNKEGEKDMK